MSESRTWRVYNIVGVLAKDIERVISLEVSDVRSD